MGFEPTTFGITIRRSNRLNYSHRNARIDRTTHRHSGQRRRSRQRLIYGNDSRNSRYSPSSCAELRPVNAASEVGLSRPA